MVVGGKGDGAGDKLSPVAIEIDKEGHANVEKCGNRKGFNKVVSFVSGQGHFLSGSLVLCPQAKKECTMIGGYEMKTFKTENRHSMPSSIKLNDSTMWITNYQGHTEFRTVNSSRKGINLPFEISCKTVIKLHLIKNLIYFGMFSKRASFLAKTFSTI